MPQVVFTPNLKRHLACEPQRVDGATVAEALDAVFADNPALRGYVLDEQGRLRRHVVVFADGEMIRDRLKLSDPLDGVRELYVMQALSGG